MGDSCHEKVQYRTRDAREDEEDRDDGEARCCHRRLRVFEEAPDAPADVAQAHLKDLFCYHIHNIVYPCLIFL